MQLLGERYQVSFSPSLLGGNGSNLNSRAPIENKNLMGALVGNKVSYFFTIGFLTPPLLVQSTKEQKNLRARDLVGI